MLLAGTAHAQSFEGKKIVSVGVRYVGARTVDEARIRGNMSIRVGMPYSAARLDDDVRSLYSSGLVDDVRFFAEGVGSGVRVIAEVKTRGEIVGVGFVGNTKFSERKLANVTKLEAGGVMTDSSILTARRNIQDHYRGFGYADVTVTHRVQPAAAGASELIFVIDEGARAEVRKIRFEGNTSIQSHVLRNEMKTKQKGWFSFFTKSGRIDVEKLDEDVDRVLDYYRNRGYLRVSASVRREPATNDRVDLVISIQEGQKYTVAQVGFGKLTVFKASELVPGLTLTAGQGYSLEKMRADVTTLRSYYGSRGYADVAISPDITNVSDTSIAITYRIIEGPRSKVGRITIEGNDKSQDRVIRRELPMKPGEFLSSVDMDTTRRRLQNMNYFNDIQVNNSPSDQSGYRDVNILVDEKKTGSVSFGLGFSSADSIVGNISLEQTNFDITNWPRFTGAGQRFNSSLQIGSERTDFTISLTEPWFLGQRLALSTELFYRDALFLSPEYEQSQFGAAISLRKPVSKRAFVSAEYRIEEIEIDPEGDTSPIFQAEEGDFVRSAISFNYVYDSRDSNQLPRKGHKIDLGATFAGGFLGGDVDIFVLKGSASKHWNLWGDSILNVRGAFTVVDTHGDTDQVPIFDREFLGGPLDLRGFDNRDVGPRDPITEEVFGGNTSAFATIEYTFPLIDRVRGAIFYDVGLVNEDSFDFGNDVFHDAGFGVRLNLPFGPLAIDYAIPFSSPDDIADQGGQFQFYLDFSKLLGS